MYIGSTPCPLIKGIKNFLRRPEFPRSLQKAPIS